jgi:hypothetical protein
MASVHDHFSEQFRKWEVRGRGWQLFPQPVHPEPPFTPFAWRGMTEVPATDDGSRPSFLVSLFRKVAGPSPSSAPSVEPIEEPEPIPLTRDALTELQIVLPQEFDGERDSLDQFFSSIALCREPLTFELLGVHKKVTAQFVCASNDTAVVRRQLQTYFPQVQVKVLQNDLLQAWNTCSGEEELVVDCGLGREFVFMLSTEKFEPFVGIVGALSQLRTDELGLFQVLWQPVSENWRENILNAVTDGEGKPSFVNMPELTEAAEQKASKPLYAAIVRIAAKAATFERAVEIASGLAAALRVFGQPNGNELIPLKNDGYPFDEHIEDVIRRQSRRTGMLLNSEELAGFVHLPSGAVQSPVLLRDSGMTRPAPEMLRHPPGIVIGDNEHLGDIAPVYLADELRVRHTHIIGVSGTGKSSLLFNMIRQDIENGAGVAVLDPHGDLVKQILGIIPDGRIDDVVLMDTSDMGFPVSFNILEAHSQEERDILASDLISVFRRFSTSWGDQMDTVLQNAILAILKSERGGTLRDLQRFLAETPFRNEFLDSVQDEFVRDFWKNIFPHLTGGKSVGSVLARLQDFFSREAIRNIVSQRTNKLDFAGIMDNRKIFLARLPKGLGNENSYLLGTLLISKFQQIAMARASQEESLRENFWIYIDEFANFITPSMAEILAETRKYHVGLVLAHHQLHQLESSPEVTSAVLAHPCTRIVFRVEDGDARKLAEGFESFEAERLKTLEKFHAIARVERNDFDFSLKLRKPELPEPSQAENRRKAVIAASQAKYATPKAEVEASLLAGMKRDRPKPPPDDPPISRSPKPPTPPPPVPVAVSPPEAAEIPKVTVSEKKTVESPRDLGRGGAQHKAIQQRIKKAAEELGFRSDIEKPLVGGQGVDLLLERDNQTFACEISFTTTIDHEVGNVTKCLKAGFSQVTVICLEDERLRKIEKAVLGSFGSELAGRVQYFQPDPFIEYLKGLKAPVPQPSETQCGGYNIRRSTPDRSPQERRQKEDVANRIIAEAMRKKP